MSDDHINHPLVKASVALASLFTIDWLTTAGKVCAAVTSIAIFSEWIWKKVLRPLISKWRNR
jgi:hypothetical protein